MSYLGSKSDARAAIASVEESNTMGHANTSPILHGTSSPGGAANGTSSDMVQMVGRLRHGIKTPMTRTGELTRKYGSTGSN